MELFEEFENDLEQVYKVKDLAKIMLANGVKAISLNENGVTVELTVAGLILNVPKEKWEVLVDGDYATSVGIRSEIYNIVCQITKPFKDDFTKATGFDFKAVE